MADKKNQPSSEDNNQQPANNQPNKENEQRANNDNTASNNSAGNIIADENSYTVILDNGIYNAKLDPNSTEFDVKLYKQKLQERKAAFDLKQEKFKAAFEKVDKEALQDFIASTQDAMQRLEDTVKPVVKDIANGIKETMDKVKEIMPTKEELAQYDKFLTVLVYYELQKKEYAGYTIDDLEFSGTDEKGEPLTGSLFDTAINNARTFVIAMEQELQTPKYKDFDFDTIKAQGIDENDKIIAGSLLDNLFKDTKTRQTIINIARNERYLPPKEKASKEGAIVTLDGALAAFSSDELQNAFNAFSLMSLVDTVDNYSFDDTGKLNTLNLAKDNYAVVDDIDTAALEAVLKAVIKTNKINPFDGNTKVKLYLPSICKELNIDVRGFETKRDSTEKDYSQLYYDVFAKKILPFDKFIGRLPNGSIYRVLTISSYDKETKTLVLDTPYMFKALELAIEKKEKEGLIYLNDLFMPNTITERTHAAVELATKITNGLLRRGFTVPNEKDKDGNLIFVWDMKYSNLISECPQLSAALNKCKSRQAINSKLKSTFNAAYRIIKTKTTAKDYFENLTINETVPKIIKTCF